MNTFSIDWISLTMQGDDALLFAKRHFLGALTPTPNPKGMYGYKSRATFDSGAIMLHSFASLLLNNEDNAKQHAHFMLSGTTLTKIWKETGISPFEIMQIAEDYSARCSRVDFAVDVRGEILSVPSLHEAKNTSKTLGRNAQRSLVLSKNDGATAYFGSRQSDKFLRVYNKAAEQGLANTLWTRIELECKGEIAHALGWHASRVSEAEFYSIGCAYIKSVFDCEHAVWAQALSDASATLDAPKQDKKDTIAWLMKSCAPALARLILENPKRALWADFCDEVNRLIEEAKNKASF